MSWFYTGKGIDPIAISATVIGALQNIVSREIAAASPAVVTVGQIHGGFAYNIIPDEVVLEGTIRATSQQVRQKLSERELLSLQTQVRNMKLYGAHRR